MDDSDQGTVRAAAEIDSSGVYQLLVTPGDYFLQTGMAVDTSREHWYLWGD